MVILLALLAGIGAGYLLREQAAVVDTTNKLSVLLVYALLFLLGVSVGGNETIVASLDRLGWQALALSVGSIGGSVLLAFLLNHFLFRPHEE